MPAAKEALIAMRFLQGNPRKSQNRGCGDSHISAALSFRLLSVGRDMRDNDQMRLRFRHYPTKRLTNHCVRFAIVRDFLPCRGTPVRILPLDQNSLPNLSSNFQSDPLPIIRSNVITPQCIQRWGSRSRWETCHSDIQCRSGKRTPTRAAILDCLFECA